MSGLVKIVNSLLEFYMEKKPPAECFMLMIGNVGPAIFRNTDA